MKTIEVLGTGCSKCITTAKTIEQVAAELGQHVSVEKVTDLERIMAYKVMATPAVAIDGKLVHTGSIPDREKISNWLQG
ncbi:thiol-disulfide isomerase/thioredoxin [Alcaligenes faecalis subsp. faecalis NCIB 8687]|uniref:Thioredoxin n=1 Tax=Alcaligenes faecalis TaxID=511 RepID=Q6WB45_ALCFA|nr:thioredoxin [Alcaligenes faecalis subsp. faecalis NCIB 8687]EJC61044.1 thiol-disulfide isomerase/thioredoxin [Alcaligenes faecalis subsp. faecalis NCIB 8687]EJC61977.1 thiol-disulfide isomerase/thioredoxin [Alcaligenes faecalis subsp. faecalis NCIB 8687]